MESHHLLLSPQCLEYLDQIRRHLSHPRPHCLSLHRVLVSFTSPENIYGVLTFSQMHNRSSSPQGRSGALLRHGLGCPTIQQQLATLLQQQPVSTTRPTVLGSEPEHVRRQPGILRPTAIWPADRRRTPATPARTRTRWRRRLCPARRATSRKTVSSHCRTCHTNVFLARR